MQDAITTTHIDDVPVEHMERREGWAISEFRLPVSGAHGSATTAFHSVFRPGSKHARHLHHDSDEIAVYLQGHGVVGQGDSRAEVGAGHCRLMPRGSEHFFFNETTAEDAIVIGFYIGAASVAGSGYECCGDVRPADLVMPRAGLNEGIHVRLQDVGSSDTTGFDTYSAAEVRLPIGGHNGSANALIQAVIEPGGALGDHRLDNCEQLYFVVRGSGVVRSGAQRLPVRAGHFILVPKGTEFGLQNTDIGAPLELIGVLTGAGSLADAGYVGPGRASKEVSPCP
jgi:mannose-6-phosphate isomerase-like protein (cupin superfamily)